MANKIYLAAPWDHKDEMPEIAEKLEAQGWTITRKWWQDDEESKPLECATEDRNGVYNADCLLLINSKKSEGKAVEQGIAIARGIPIIAVGVKGEHAKNVFHHLPIYYWTEKLDTAIQILDFVKEVTKDERGG